MVFVALFLVASTSENRMGKKLEDEMEAGIM